jgi:hypothetical protein
VAVLQRGRPPAPGDGLAGTGGSSPALRVAPEQYRAEIAAARELGLPVSVHACGPPAAAGQLRAYARDDLLGPDLQVVHLNNASPAELALAARAGTPVSVSPWTELQIGYGQPVTGEVLAAGLPAGPRDVELVLADGRILKRDGVITAVDVPDVVHSARQSLAAVLSRATA